MTILKIEQFPNGGHDNQTTTDTFPVPDGWALVPDGMELENFPFGEVTAAEIDGVMTVTEWTPLPMPEPEPIPEPEPTELEQLRADVDYIAMETGVEL
jgi:hypothetical protein